MAQLRGQQTQAPDDPYALNNGLPASSEPPPGAVPDVGVPMTGAPSGGGTSGGAGTNAQTPRERPNPTAGNATPSVPQNPTPNPGNTQMFGGGGSSTISPPSATAPAPFAPLPSPQTETMLGAGSKMFGNSEGRLGGGQGLPDTGNGANQPSDLILSLLQLLQ